MPSQYATIEIQVHPELLTPDRFAALMEKLSDFNPILQKAGEIITDELAENFSSDGFGSWAPLKDKTEWEKHRKGYPPKMLVRTGDLQAAISFPNAPGHKMLISPTGILVGIYDDVIPYAKYLDSGTSRMPGRALIQVRPEMKEELLDIVRAWLVGATGDPNAVTVVMGSPIQAA